MSRRLVLLVPALAGVLSLAAPAQSGEPGESGESGQDPAPAPPAEDKRTPREILQQILHERDRVDLDVFEVLGARRDEESLRVLEQSTLAIFSRPALEALFAAFRHYAGASDPDALALQERALAFLAKEAMEGFPYKQRSAVRALTHFHGEARAALEAVLRGNPDRVCRQIAVGGLVPALRADGSMEALALLLAWFRPGVSGPHELGVRTLRSFDRPEMLRAMAKTLRDKHVPDDVKAMTLEALVGMPGADVADLIVDGLRSKLPAVQLAAIAAVRADPRAEQRRDLERLLRAKDAAVRRAALAAQVVFHDAGDDAWRRDVLRAAESRDHARRMGAALVMAELGDGESLAKLIALLADEHPLVRRDAIDGLRALRRREAIEPLIARMEIESLRLRGRIQDALMHVTGLDHGRTAARWRDWWAAEGAGFAVPSLESVLRMNLARAARSASGVTEAAFYGIRVRSDRVCFVLDVSGSMDNGGEDLPSGSKLDAVKRELVETLESMPDGARFNLVFFASRAHRWKKELIELDARTRKQAVRHVRQQIGNGGTALFDGLVAAFDDDEVDTIFLLTDGQPTQGKIVDPLEILREVRALNRLRQVVIHCVAVDFQGELLRELAETSGGTYTEVE